MIYLNFRGLLVVRNYLMGVYTISILILLEDEELIYYCPKCGKLDTDFKMTRDTPSVGNIRDGYGRLLYHMKCDCGNYLAAGMNFSKDEIDKEQSLIEYIKHTITEYNKDGSFYHDGFYEYVEKRISDIERHNKEELEERKRIMGMSESEKKEYFYEKYEEIMRRIKSDGEKYNEKNL